MGLVDFISLVPPLLAVRQAQSFCTDCNLSIGLWGYSGVVLREAHSKKSASRLKEADRLNQSEKFAVTIRSGLAHPRRVTADSDRDFGGY
jgi:hypothetical protein